MASQNRVAIVAGLRTPFVKSSGAFRTMSAQELGTQVVNELLAKSGVSPKDVDRVVYGQVVPSLSGPNIAREIVLDSGMRREIDAYSVTRACATSYQAAVDVAQAIAAGDIEVGIAGGADSASDVPIAVSKKLAGALIKLAKARTLPDRLKAFGGLSPKDLLPEPPALKERSTGLTMGEHAERMAQDNRITREAQDGIAHQSHVRAAAAWADGRYAQEVMTVQVPPRYDAPVGEDNLVRKDSDLASYAALRPAFDKKFGTITAGNSSPLTDGASAIVMMSEARAKALGLTPIAYLKSYAFTALDPRGQMLMGPAYAIPKALERAGLSFGNLELVDLHEAFAAQVLSVTQALESKAWAEKHLGRTSSVVGAAGTIDMARFNVMGGSIALGHPFAATGTRQITTVARELGRRGGGFGVLAACAAGGLGAAMILEVEKWSAVALEKDGDVAVLVIDMPGEPVNTLSPRFSDAFESALTAASNDPSVRAIVVTSGKKDSFIAGADIKVLETVTTAAQATEMSKQGQAAMQRLADSPKPIVAAIHGACLGGGLELAMACHARVATSDKKTKLGLPEVQLGLLPGAGGTQRLPKLVGITTALDMILTGKQVDGRRAKKMGLVDEVCPAPMLREVAVKVARELVEAHGKDKGGSALDVARSWLGKLTNKEELTELVLEDNPLGRKVLFDQARKKLLAKTHGNYPGPEKALEAVRVGASGGDGYEAEARLFGELLVSDVARELIGIFFATTAMKKDTGIDDPKVTARPVDKIGMLGAGLMGAGIAYVTATASGGGIGVRLKDKDAAGLGKGLAYARGILDGRVKRRRMTPRERDDVMAKISPTTEYTGLGDAQVIVEAVFEDIALKHQIVRDVEAATGPETIFASNTSTIPITTIAKASRHPETVIGMHYFSPVHKMPLLEVIVTERTAPWVTATCVELGKRQGKTVIVVRDGVGFYTSRILGPYVNEAFHVLAEGVAIDKIDAALLKFGFPVGPVKLLDEVGVDVANKASGVVKRVFGDRMDSPPGMDQLMADQRFGRKVGKGFYLYPKDEGKKDDDNRGVDPTVYAVLGITPTTEMNAGDIARRCWLQMVNEAAHCYGEGVLRSARDGDIGAIFGLGFPPFRGGPFRWADTYGVAKLVGDLDELSARFGKRFAAAPVLRAMAKTGKRFYPTGGASVQLPGEHGRPPTLD